MFKKIYFLQKFLTYITDHQANDLKNCFSKHNIIIYLFLSYVLKIICNKFKKHCIENLKKINILK